MGFEYLTNVPPEKAAEDYIQWLLRHGFTADSETVAVTAACGRATAEAVYAAICAPHYAASAMDGVALDARLSFGATDSSPVTLQPGQFTRLDTGDAIPQGCDAVIMIEDIVDNDDGSISIHAAAAPWQHIRQIGEDICAGEMILPAHVSVSPSAIGAMIAGGVSEISVIRKPVIGIIPTGDELVQPCPEPKPGDILEFNGAIFSAMLKLWGAEAVVYPIVPDDFDAIKAMTERAGSECDIVLLNAGSSAGREDYSAAVMRELGQVLYHGIAMKPGKPAILGRRGRVPIVGVPGYPVSGIIAIEQFVKPLLEHWLKAAEEPPRYVEASLSRPVVSGLKYKEFVRVRMGYVNGRLIAAPLSRGSGVVSSFMKADGMLEIPQGLEGYEAGSRVRVRLLCPEEKLKNTLMLIGSHDPLLDELGNMLHQRDNNIFMSSAHVGSMGGIMALRRGEAHAAGCHLLDTATGEYNRSFIKKYFPKGGVKLVRCVGRVQGLMVAPGNPLGIEEFSQLAMPGLRYVNRQKGSGTRILCDYLCSKNDMDSGGIYGYDREELTHTSVAAQIASGSADAGLGIYSAAKLYKLDFIPLCTEEYDLLIPDFAWDSPKVRLLIQTLKSPDFAQKLEAMGGYTLDRPGEIIEL